MPKVLARKFLVEVQDPLNSEWVPIKGLETIGFSGSKEDADTTDFESDGFTEHVVASRSYEVSLEGFWVEDPTTGERDPGQEIVESLAEKVGEESLGTFRITSPGGKVRTFKASASVEGPSGGKSEMAKWSATLTVSGRVTSE